MRAIYLLGLIAGVILLFATEAETAARIAMEVEAAKREREERAAKVEAECLAYGYGRGEHYSSFSGWGNYCGD